MLRIGWAKDSRVRGNDWHVKGQITVWLVMIFPLLALFLCFFVNTAVMVNTKIRMQGAVDRGMYAGASYLAYVMNEVAGLNLKFREKFLATKKEFKSASEDTAKLIEKRVKELNHNQVIYNEETVRLLADGYSKAQKIAEEVALKNLSTMPQIVGASYHPVYGKPDSAMFDMINDCIDDGRYINKEFLTATEIEDNSMDPSKYTPHGNLLHGYLVKDENSFVALTGVLAAYYRPPLLSSYFAGDDSVVDFRVIAGAQPYGGSIKEFAISGGNEKFLYHPMIVPVKSILESADVAH